MYYADMRPSVEKCKFWAICLSWAAGQKNIIMKSGNLLPNQTFDELILIGTNAEQIGKAMKDKKSNIPVRVMDKKEDAVAYLKEHLGEGDVVYLKASNGMKLKEITKALMENDN